MADDGAACRGCFFVAIVFGAVYVLAVLLQVIFSSGDVVDGGLSLNGCGLFCWRAFGSLFDCIRRAFIRYYTSPEGIERRGLMGRKMLPWSEVEAVGTQKKYIERVDGWMG